MSDEQTDLYLITGTQGALASVVAEHFLTQGARVVGADLGYEHEGLEEQQERFHTVALDATDAGAVGEVVAQVREQLGPIHGLIHCAGGFRWSKLDELADEDLDFLLGANLRSTLLMVREVLGAMKEAGRGRVVLMSSKSTLNPGVGEAAYAATKAGINAIVKAVAAEVADSEITINALLPSVIDTPANREAMPDEDFSTWVKREQVAEIMYALVTELGDPINGALVPVAGRT